MEGSRVSRILPHMQPQLAHSFSDAPETQASSVATLPLGLLLAARRANEGAVDSLRASRLALLGGPSQVAIMTSRESCKGGKYPSAKTHRRIRPILQAHSMSTSMLLRLTIRE